MAVDYYDRWTRRWSDSQQLAYTTIPPRTFVDLAPTPVAPGAAFYILWNPESSKSPSVRYATLKEAEAVAQDMARRHAPQTFFVCKVGMAAKVADPPVTLTRLTEPAAKRKGR